MSRFAVPAGMVVKGWTVRLEPVPAQAAQWSRDCGARRFAHNWAVTQMGEAFGRGHATGDWGSAIWSARKAEGSRRWRQARQRLARTHARAANVRSDALHQATTRLAKTHGQVVIEDLGVRQLARGLRSHRKSWADAAAGEMRRQLTYKAGWYGCELWLADRFYPSSRTCSACGLVNGALTLPDRRWTCPGCGTGHDRDENAGVNLARLPASWAEAQSDGKTAPVRRAAMKRVNRPGRAAA